MIIVKPRLENRIYTYDSEIDTITCYKYPNWRYDPETFSTKGLTVLYKLTLTKDIANMLMEDLYSGEYDGG